MISTTPKLTTAGTSLLIRALAGEAITFTGFKIGNGDPPANPDALTDLVNPLLSFGVSGLDRSQPGQVILRGMFDNSDVQSEFRVKEFGIFAQGEKVKNFTSVGDATFTLTDKPPAVNSAKVDGDPATISSYNPSTGVVTLSSAPTSGKPVDIRYPDGTNLLYAYANDGANAGMIRAYASDVVSEEAVIVYLEISSNANVTAYLTPDAAYVLQTDFDDHLAATNPHQITPQQIGLGNVDNVHLADYTPTFTEASTFSNIDSGTKFSVIFGKIKKAISTLISHIANHNNPHGVTLNQMGAAAREHIHSANDITSGILPVARGGTGVTDVGALKAMLGQPVAGYYEGDSTSKRHIDLGFQPTMVILGNQTTGVNVGLAVPGHGVVSSSCSVQTHEYEWNQSHTLILIDETGFFVNSSVTNTTGKRYRYIAFR